MFQHLCLEFGEFEMQVVWCIQRDVRAQSSLPLAHFFFLGGSQFFKLLKLGSILLSASRTFFCISEFLLQNCHIAGPQNTQVNFPVSLKRSCTAVECPHPLSASTLAHKLSDTVVWRA